MWRIDTLKFFDLFEAFKPLNIEILSTISFLQINMYSFIYTFDNTGLQGFVVEKLWVVSEVIFDVKSESRIRISLSCQDFEIIEVMCSKNGGFRYFWGYVQGARNFFGFFLKCHHLALLFSLKMSYWTVTSDFFSQRYGHTNFDIYPNNLMSIHIESLVHTILYSKIYLENLCLRVLIVCE